MLNSLHLLSTDIDTDQDTDLVDLTGNACLHIYYLLAASHTCIRKLHIVTIILDEQNPSLSGERTKVASISWTNIDNHQERTGALSSTCNTNVSWKI